MVDHIKQTIFLYGIVFDPLHTDQEYDRFMGPGSYRVFCEYLDRLFLAFVKSQQIPPEEVKSIMNILPDFLNRKISYYLQHGIIERDGADQIVGNFNRIWNSMQIEYRSFFSQNDIDGIAKRAGIK